MLGNTEVSFFHFYRNGNNFNVSRSTLTGFQLLGYFASTELSGRYHLRIIVVDTVGVAFCVATACCFTVLSSAVNSPCRTCKCTQSKSIQLIVDKVPCTSEICSYTLYLLKGFLIIFDDFFVYRKLVEIYREF